MAELVTTILELAAIVLVGVGLALAVAAAISSLAAGLVAVGMYLFLVSMLLSWRAR